jgi:subtilisin-like proprotein convertase family protein
MKKAWFFSLLILAAVLGVVLTSKQSPSSAAQSSTGVPPVMEPPRQAGRLPYTSDAISEAEHLAPFLSAPITLQDGGIEQKFELVTDQLYIRGRDGASGLLQIPQTNTPEAFASAIEKARSENGIEPELVLYHIGFPRNEYTRRIVTREVVVNAPNRAEADALAAAQGLVFKKSPVFAPNSFVYEAPTSAKSLSVQADKKASIEATPLLASRAAKMSMPNDPFVHLQWHLKYQNQQGAVAGTDINVESVWNYPSTSSSNSTRGRGVVIGIVDDGLQWSHPDLRPNVLPDLQYDWNGKDNDPNPLLYHSHGTQCGGVAAARGNNRIGVSGVAPDSGLAGMRLIADDFTDLDVAEAMTWKVNEIKVLSNSWGYRAFAKDDDGFFAGWYLLRQIGAMTEAALKYAVDFGRGGKGTIITFSAGNDDELYLDKGNGTIAKEKSGARMDFSPLKSSIYTIAVGAVDSLGSKANYSQIGSSLLISAPSLGAPPSLGIMTTDNKGNYGSNPGFGQYDFPSSGDVTKNFNGTSAACPVVSGVVALMLEKNSDLGWRDVQEILIRSAKKVDLADTDWIDNGAGYHFNHKYGAGLVDAAAAVNLASTWNNLGPQKSQSFSTTVPLSIAPGATVNRTFSANEDDLRLEHVTLRLTIESIKKGDLTIKLTSPDGTESVFCEPHSDNINNFTNWKFMTVRNWGEMSNGDWTLSITNHGATSGNLTDAELVVYGTESGAATNPAPVVTLAASRTQVFVGSNLTLNATAIDQNADATTGTVEALEAFANGTSLGLSENGRWTVQANEAGTFSFMVNATDSEGETSTSQSVVVEVLEAPIAAWDFDTTSQSPVPLATAVQSIRKYAANFGSGNLTFDGSFDGDVANSNKWEYGQGQIFMADGTVANAVADMGSGSGNKALLLRGGKNIGAEGKSIVFEFSMAGKEGLNVNYAAGEMDGGFDTHKWSWSNDGTNWTDIITIAPASWWFDVENLPVINDLNNTATAYLRLKVSGSTAASGQNFIDNIVFSASPITAPFGSDSFTLISKTSAKASLSSAPSKPNAPTRPGDSQAATNQTAIEQNLDWVAPEGGSYSMFVYAEVVEGAEFLSAPGSLLSVSNGNDVLGLAESLPQTTRYDMAVSSSEAGLAPLRLRLYDGKRRIVLAMDEKLEFESGTIIGSPTDPVRYRVAYEEIEQRISLKQGWNTFTTAVDPQPSNLGLILSDYDAAEGDRVLGPHSDAVYRNGAWMPADFVLDAETNYSLWRQRTGNSEITLLGKALKENLPLMPSASSSSTPSSTPLESPALQGEQNAGSTDYTSNTKSTPAAPSQTASSASGGGRPESTKTSSKKLKSGKKKSFKKSKNRAVNS